MSPQKSSRTKKPTKSAAKPAPKTAPKTAARTVQKPATKRAIAKAAPPSKGASPKAAPTKAPRGRGRAAAAKLPAPVSEPLQIPAPPPALESTASTEAIVASTRPPERTFAERAPTAMPDRPRPVRRRAVFIDVENTSRLSRVQDALETLAIDHGDAFTDLVASGNWRVIGNETARLLARKGFHLVHSAPATGVRDWSDLRIAVSAGVWLASARPGDRLEIVSDDRAFDAVGDVAATLGVDFKRYSYRDALRGAAAPAGVERAQPERAPRGPRERRGPGERPPRGSGDRPPRGPGGRAPMERGGPPPAALEGAPVPAVPGLEEGGPAKRSRRRRGGRGRGPAPVPGAAPTQLAFAVAAPADFTAEVAPPAAEEPTAPEGPAQSAETEDLLQVVSELLADSPNGVSLDALGHRLRSLGFARPPGSPRLVTRVRAVKELSVAPNGVIRLASSPGPIEEGEPSTEPQAEGAEGTIEGSAEGTSPAKRRSRRRGGRGRRKPEQT